MYCDLPKPPPQQPQYVVERSVIKTSPVSKKENNPFEEPAQHAENFGGLFVGNASGTTVTASDISSSASAEIPDDIDYIPEFGVLPTVEMEKQHMGDVISWPTQRKPSTPNKQSIVKMNLDKITKRDLEPLL